MNSPPKDGNDPVITQFKPVESQLELNDDNIKHIDDWTGNTILHNYCEHINTTPIEVIKYLVEIKGCNVNVPNQYQNTPVELAICNFDINNGGDPNLLIYLLNQSDVSVNIRNGNGISLFSVACYNINKLPLDIFQHLIEVKGGDVNAQNQQSMTPIHHALDSFDFELSGNTDNLLYLLSQNDINVNEKDLFGRTLLNKACDNINRSSLDVFKCLIETKGGDVNALDRGKSTPLYDALRFFEVDTGDVAILTYLLGQENVNVNKKNLDGYNLLHWACLHIDSIPFDVFKFIVEINRADVNMQDDRMNTPLYYTFHRPTSDFSLSIYLLNQNGVNLNITDRFGRTLLHLTCMLSLTSSVEGSFTSRGPRWVRRRDVGDKTEAEIDTSWSQIAELVIQTYLQQILDDSVP
jgi:ankyrin repeat protein